MAKGRSANNERITRETDVSELLANLAQCCRRPPSTERVDKANADLYMIEFNYLLWVGEQDTGTNKGMTGGLCVP